MLSILYFTFLLLLANIVKGDSPPIRICSDNEEYICGSYCTETCNHIPQPCIKPCRFDCFCLPGYVRQSNNTKSPCIKREDCKKELDVPQCGENEEYKDCGTACPETCDYKPQGCNKQCVLGCFCKSNDYVRKDNSTNSPCIERKECPVKVN